MCAVCVCVCVCVCVFVCVCVQGFIQDLNLGGGGNEGVSCKFKFCECVSCEFLSITSFNPQLAWGGKVALGGEILVSHPPV